MNVVRLRLKMSDWVKTEIEEYLINRLAELHKIHQFKLHLWYDDGDLSPTELKKFITKYEKQLFFRTIITPTSDIKRNDFIWYDIIPSELKPFDRTRFTYAGDIFGGLLQFQKTLEFCMKPRSETPIRKQKRND